MKITLILTLILLLVSTTAAEWDSTGNVLIQHYNNDSAYGEGDALAYDFTGLGNNGTITGAVYAAGKYGNALSFDGVDDYVKASNVNLGFNGGTEISVELWLNSNDTSGRVISKEISEGWNTFYIAISSQGVVSWNVNNKVLNQYPNWKNSVAFSSGWHHIVCTFKKNTFDANDGKIYIDGVSVATTYTANVYNSSFTLGEDLNNLYLGVRPITLTDPLNGSIDEVRIYNRTLTTDEILEHASTPPPSECNSCDDCELKLDDVTYNDVRMTNDVTDYAGTCINDPANFNNKIFDCQRHTIDGDETGNDWGIYLSTQTNNTIKNCGISGFWKNIGLYSASHYTTIADCNLTNSSYAGIWSQSSSYHTIRDVNITNSAKDGLYLYTSTYNNISNVYIENITEDGFDFYQGSDNNNVTNVTVIGAGWSGIYGKDSNNNNITSSVVFACTSGIFWYSGTGNVINANVLCSSTTRDIYAVAGNSGDNNTCDIPDGWNDTGTTGCTYICGYDYQGTCEGYTATCDSSKTKYVLRFTDVEKCCVDYLQPLQDQVRSGSGTMEINGTCSVNNHGLTMTGHDCSGYPLWYILVFMVLGFGSLRIIYQKYKRK